MLRKASPQSFIGPCKVVGDEDFERYRDVTTIDQTARPDLLERDAILLRAWGTSVGYGLAFSVPVLINRERHFDLVANHYRNFDVEPGPATGMDLVVDVPANGRFSTFLELIQLLTRQAQQETVLVVNHGMSDANDNPLGLILPLTASSGAAWNPEEYTLGLLADFVGKSPSDADYAAAEKGSTVQNAQGQTVTMPSGTLKPLDTALRALRALNKLKRLELRACNLGGNTKVLQLLGKALGVTKIVAPQVHMFYCQLPAAGFLPDNAAGFVQWVRHHPRSRTFTDTPTSHRVGLQINGQHAFRTFDFDCDDLDLKWFVEGFICPGSGYVSRTPARNAHINPFSFGGMDFRQSFVLARENDYVGQLVEVTP